MADNENFLDQLPFGSNEPHQLNRDDIGDDALEAAQVESTEDEETEPDARTSTERKEVVRKKKKVRVKKKKKKKKKKIAPPPPEEDEEEEEEEAEFDDEQAEAEEPEAEVDEIDGDEGTEAPDEEEVEDLGEADGEMGEPGEGSPLDTLPFTTPPPAEEPAEPEQQDSPTVEDERPTRRVKKKKKKKKKRSETNAAPVDRMAVNKLWDDFLGSLHNATLTALYEMGVGSILEFENYSLGELTKPRGHLTEAQAKEVETWLTEHNVQLKTTGADSAIANVRGSGRRLIRGLRIPVPGVKVPEDATSKEKRHAKFTRTRATM